MLFDPARLFIAAVSATFVVAVLAAILSWSQRCGISSRAVLAVFFAVFAISELDNVLIVISSEIPQNLRDGTVWVSMIANSCLGPIFLLYVREQTLTQDHSDEIRSSAAHFALPGAVTLFAIIAMTLPQATRELWYIGGSAPVPPPGLNFLNHGFAVLAIALAVQWALYLVWVIRTQMKHIVVLKQHFASTDGLELRWVVALSGALGTYVLQSLIGELLDIAELWDPIGPVFDSLWVLVVILSLALWGLRPATELETVVAELNALDGQHSKKYEKSALGLEQSERIARKLLYAMEKERLYRDPNLTLSSLSAHVGVSLNYVSQTLNQHLHQSFFEFVNTWRVKEAIPLVADGASTILAIAYEVGFNSRSSFYTAFKRETGKTPTGYKNDIDKAKISHGMAPLTKNGIL
jgi:AraC-like DNA-binding protein